MLALAPVAALGRSRPRIAPPEPIRSDIAALRQTAADIGIEFMAWQEVVGSYIEAIGPNDKWLFPEVGVAASRQNGKTEIYVALIVRRLRKGRRLMHTAQDRQGIVRDVFERVADIMEAKYPAEVRKVRRANGQEEIKTLNGGRYRIVAPTKSGARGPANDDVIIDEVRELTDNDFISAAEPTLAQSPNPQILYFSNAGDDSSIVLNAIRDRAGSDPALAYLEWSADPERPTDDREGWLEANPSVGALPGRDMMAYLERKYESYRQAGTLAIFETEHLCRWVPTMRPRLVDDFAWARCRVARIGAPKRPALGISYDPAAGRASVVAAWREDADHIAVRELFDVAVDETGIPSLGADALRMARSMGVVAIGYDDATDRDLARQFSGPFAKRTRSVIGKDYANASEAFVRGIESGAIQWQEADHITADLASTSRRENDEAGTFTAVRSKDDVPITAALAAIRAVWLASIPARVGRLKVY